MGSADMASPPSMARRFHLDIPLLLLLILLTIYGLFVLYSASGGQISAVIRQGRFFLIAYILMIAGAQISLARFARWAPWLCRTLIERSIE